MNYTCVDSVLKELSKLKRRESSRLNSPIKNEIETLLIELGYLRMYVWCLAKWNDNKPSCESVRKSHIKATLGKTKKGLYQSGFRALERGEFEDWDNTVSTLLEKIHHCKPKIKKTCLDLLDGSFECKFSSYELQKFMEWTFIALDNLVWLKGGLIFNENMPIEDLKQKLDLFTDLVRFTRRTTLTESEALRIHLQAWAYRALCLSVLFWVEDKMTPRMNEIYSHVLQKVMPCSQEVTGMYFRVLETSLAGNLDSFQGKKIILNFVNFVNFVLENLVLPSNDVIENLRAGLLFLISFLMDPSEKTKCSEHGKFIKIEANAVLKGAPPLISSLYYGELKADIANDWDIVLHGFLEKIADVKVEVRKLYFPFAELSSFNFPWTNLLGLVDSLLENLKELLKLNNKYVSSVKHQIMIIQEELFSLRPFLRCILELQNDHEGIKDLWRRIANVAYQAENAIKSLLFLDNSLCYDLICLSDVLNEIKLISGEVKKIQDEPMYKMRVLSAETTSHLTLQANNSRISEVIVGFEDEAEAIIDLLTYGSTQLDIVSIVGMPGLGKTTLAKKVYNNPSVKYHFNKCAWCCVSQAYKRKQLLLDILKDVSSLDDHISKMAEEDLAERLYRSLKGRRYLIVIDDIWDVRAWDALKESFPNDNNRSRIVFTSRIHNVALQAKYDCSLCPLRSLSDEDSWKLLCQKLYLKDVLPENFSKVSRKIAKVFHWLLLLLQVSSQQKLRIWIGGNKLEKVCLHKLLLKDACMYWN